MGIYDSVIAGLKLGGRRKRGELDDIVEGTLTQAALWEELQKKLKDSGTSLSGGQQRLCIARALPMEPEVILMDEPASALDPIPTQKIEDTIEALKQSYTVVIVTHTMQQAARISDHTGFFYIENMGDPGRLWEFDETEKMFSNSEHKETEDYDPVRFCAAEGRTHRSLGRFAHCTAAARTREALIEALEAAISAIKRPRQ
jgi:phosphate transport system ATP-binding protein